MKFRITAAALVASSLLAGCSTENADNAVAQGGTFQFISPGGQTVIEYAPEERAPVKDFGGTGVDGKPISLGDFAGQIVVINSWGQWCAPCRSESDDLQAVHEKLQERGIGTLLGINVKDYSLDISRDFMKDNGLTYPSLYDPPFKTAAALGGVPTSVVPTTIVLDKQHRPAAVFLKGITEAEVMEVVDRLEKE